MRYFVYRNHRVTETGRIEYDHFLQNELNNFLFSPYSSIIDDKQLSIDALYYGVMSKEEANIPLPFKLFIYKDTAEIGKEGIDMKLTLDGIEHFSDFEKMAKRRKILIKEFEKN